MERDFMGLNSKDLIVIKEEFVEGGCEDSGFARSSGVPWPWSNKPSALPQFMPLKCEQDEKSSNMKSDILASHAYMAKSGSDMFEAMHKPQSADIQNWPSSNPVDEVTMHPFSMMSPFLKPHFMENFGGANMKQQFLGGLSAPPPPPIIIPPSAASMARTTEQWNNSKASSTSAQLTIFYGGTVNVFDDITPEKAQAIIFLAGNGCVPSNMAQSNLHMQATTASKFDRAFVNQSMNMAPSSSLPNPVPDDPLGIPLANNDDVMVSKTAGMSTSVVNKVEPPRVVLPIRSPAAASSMISSVIPCKISQTAVPQARKASLSRFLEKRKERATSAAPYNLNKNITADCATPESMILAYRLLLGYARVPSLSARGISGDI